MKISDIYCAFWLKPDFLALPEVKEYLQSIKYPYQINGQHLYIDVRDTIHYKALMNNDFKLYDKLVKYTFQREHSTNNFKKLIAGFSVHKMKLITVSAKNGLNKPAITDGVHRLSILIFKKIINEDTDIRPYLFLSNSN